MSWRKKKNTKKGLMQKQVVLLFSFAALLLTLFVVMLFEMFINNDKKSYYIMKSRVSDAAMAKDSNSNGNYQVVGWVKVQGTKLDMPILTGIDDNSDFPVKMEKYVWDATGDGKFHNKLNIMGHNIYNLSSHPKKSSNKFNRFEELMSFVYYDYAKENKYIQITINNEDYLYKIFSVDFINAVDVDMFPKGEYSASDLRYQIDLFKQNTLYDYDVDVNENDSLVSLITCTRFFGSDKYIDFLVNGRLVREGEKIDNYPVKINKVNYDKVEAILKGDDENESDSSM